MNSHFNHSKNQIKSKKGQGVTGSSAATLVAVLALIVVLYVLFLPPDERQDLLGETGNNDGSSSGTSSSRNETLVSVHPGTMDYLDLKEVDHDISSFNLNAKINSKVLKKSDAFAVINGWFTKKEYLSDFTIDDLASVSDVPISFNVKKGKGVLLILLNGEEVYSGSPEGTVTFSIDKSKLKNQNTLKFAVSGSGIKFWSENEYSIQDLRLVADVLEKTTLESKSSFVMTATEKDNLDKASLRFTLDCASLENLGKIDVLVNDHSIYSSAPDCGSIQKVDFSPVYLLSGENTVTFKATGGSYIVDRILLKTTLKDIVYPTYFFKLSHDQFMDVSKNKINATLVMKFVNDVDYKKGNIYVNGNLLHLDQREKEYNKSINAYLKEDDNAIELIPKTRLNVLTLQVNLDN